MTDKQKQILIFIILKAIELSVIALVGFGIYWLYNNVSLEQMRTFFTWCLDILVGIWGLAMFILLIIKNWEWAEDLISWWRYRK